MSDKIKHYGPDDTAQYPWDERQGGWFCKDCDAPWGRGHYPGCLVDGAVNVQKEKLIDVAKKNILWVAGQHKDGITALELCNALKRLGCVDGEITPSSLGMQDDYVIKVTGEV